MQKRFNVLEDANIYLIGVTFTLIGKDFFCFCVSAARVIQGW